MVKTWKDSWFAEDGVRILYVLPQSWTERTLPMLLNPTPQGAGARHGGAGRSSLARP